MAKLESNFKNMVIVLTSVALIAAFLLAVGYNLTSKPIEKAKLAKQQKAIKEVLPPYDVCREPENVNNLNVYKAYKNDQFVGAAVESFSPNGFSGEIRVMVGFDKEGNIYNYVVLEQKETPGLGTKILDWFKSDKGKRSIINKNPQENPLKVTIDGGSIDAITAATISSRAFLESVMTAYEAYANNSEAPDAKSGASSQSQEEKKPDTTAVQVPDTVSIIPIEIKKPIRTSVPVVEKRDTQRIKIIKPIIIQTDSLEKNKDIIEEELLKRKDSVINRGAQKNKDTTETKEIINSISVDSISTIEEGGENER